MENKYSIYFYMCIGKHKMQYYSMLYYSLETLFKHYEGGYDVYVSVASDDFDIWNEDYLGLNLVKAFPQVIFEKSEFSPKKYNVYLQKWHDLEKVFSRGYERIFLFDVDTIFYGDIKYIFEKYNGDYIYSLREGHNPEFFKVLGEAGIPSGQLVIPKSVIEKTPGLFQQIFWKQKKLIRIAKHKLDNETFNWFSGLSEQYAAQKVFSENGCEYVHLMLSDVGMGIEDFEIKCDNGELNIKVLTKAKAASYMSANYHLFLPDEYMEEDDVYRKKQYCLNDSSSRK